ncbi:MAG: hypothetical protein R2911_41010 [Caldilineaceae bacterium]
MTIARALVNNPAIVWADEPTGSLDSEAAGDILQLMRRLNQEQGQTLVIVTHDPQIGQQCDRIIRMQDGQIAADEVSQQGVAVEFRCQLQHNSFTHNEISLRPTIFFSEVPRRLAAVSSPAVWGVSKPERVDPFVWFRYCRCAPKAANYRSLLNRHSLITSEKYVFLSDSPQYCAQARTGANSCKPSTPTSPPA